MAVEARHRNQQLFCNNSEIMNPVQLNGGMYGSQVSYGGLVAVEALLPVYNNSMMNEMPPKTTPFPAMQSESCLTYNVPISTTTLSRKRSRVDPSPNLYTNNAVSFLGEDISRQIQHQQNDIDQYISQHMEKVRAEIEEKRKLETRRIMECIENGMMKRLRAKAAEMEKIGKINFALEEKVKSLCAENQIWRDLALTNEATANALRTNLEQVMQVKQDNKINYADDDVESCCGDVDDGGGRRLCRNCGEEESCVLVLPCRHLCLCTVCGSTLHVCPVCKSTKNASVHVNLSWAK